MRIRVRRYVLEDHVVSDHTARIVEEVLMTPGQEVHTVTWGAETMKTSAATAEALGMPHVATELRDLGALLNDDAVHGLELKRSVDEAKAHKETDEEE
jgi:hypothetical protein